MRAGLCPSASDTSAVPAATAMTSNTKRRAAAARSPSEIERLTPAPKCEGDAE